MKQPSIIQIFILLILSLLSTPAVSQTLTPCTLGSTGGIVWRDFNNNGVKDATESVGVGGLTVKAFDCNGTLVATTTTDVQGQYTFGVLSPAPSATNKLRIEFSNLPAPYKPTFNGTNGRTDVQIISGVSCSINYGVNDPHDYCQTTPNLLTSCYVNGNQITGSNNTGAVLISFPNNAGSTSLSALDAAYDVPSTHTIDLKANQIGTTWGLAYARTTNKIYAASFFKKHSGFGRGADNTANTADDPGAVYVINPLTNLVTSTFTVPNATTNSHNTANYIVDNGNTAWDAVGKTSLGGMDLSEDEDSLFVMNLQDRKLYALNPTTGAVLNSVAMPTSLPSCGATGDARPFAVEYYKSRLYVGLICSAESNQAATSVNAYVYEVNPTTMVVGASPVFQMDMDYPRGKANNSAGHLAAWKPWRTTFATITSDNTVIYPQPLLTSLAFDKDNLILGFRDRIGDQVGQYAPDNPAMPAVTDYEPRTAGDILRACGSINSWTLESNGRCGGTGSAPQTSGQGPSNGEFYYGDAYSYSNGTPGVGDTHDEIILGGVLQIPGFPNVSATVFDPIPTGSAIFDGGVRWQSNTPGNFAQAYRLYDDTVVSGDFGKANGLGDLIALCSPEPLQVGNYVWYDQDHDGVQDPCEQPLSNIALSLWKAGVQIATTTTNSSGEYYFTGIGTAGETWTATTGTDSILPNTAYEIRIDTTNQTRLDTVKLSLTNSILNNGNDQNDSDASISGIYAVISLTTGDYGSTNHTFDFGFYPFCDTSLVLTNTTICNPTTVNLFTLVSGAKGVVKYSTNGTTWVALANPTNVTPSVSTTYYVKDSLSPICLDIDTLLITVNQPVTAGSGTNPVAYCQAGSGITNLNLFNQLTSETVGGVWSQPSGTSVGTALNTGTGILNLNGLAAGVYMFRYTVTAAPCSNDTEDITVTINACCPPSICLPINIVRN